MHIAARIKLVQAVGAEHVRGVAQFGRQLHAGGARANDGHVNARPAVRAHAPAPVLGPHAGRDQALAEALGLRHDVQCDGILGRAGHAEEMRDAADRQHQRVIGQLARRQQFGAVLVEAGRHRDGLAGAVDAGQLAQLELEVMPARLRRVFQLVRVGVHAAGCHFMQQRLPDVGGQAVHQHHLRLPLAAELVAQLRYQFQPPCSPTDDNDARRPCFCHGLPDAFL
ncbi:hypothetical protein D3C72_1596250 [compost metagenome]